MRNRTTPKAYDERDLTETDAGRWTTPDGAYVIEADDDSNDGITRYTAKRADGWGPALGRSRSLVKTVNGINAALGLKRADGCRHGNHGDCTGQPSNGRVSQTDRCDCTCHQSHT